MKTISTLLAAGLTLASVTAFAASNVTNRISGPQCNKAIINGLQVAINKNDDNAEGKWNLLNELVGEGKPVQFVIDDQTPVIPCNNGDQLFNHVLVIFE